ncbi:MAG: hypothetical protein IJ301_01535 [Clostridia bacterium]|nr:hypothetical protein [Clostridia bacterium]
MRKNKKKSKAVKTTATILACVAGTAVVAGGIVYGVPGAKDFIFGTSTTQPKVLKTGYELVGKLFGEELRVTGYYGDDTEIALPKTVSLGQLVNHRYTFNDAREFREYVDTIEQRYTQDPEFSGDFSEQIFAYSFLCSDDSLYTAKSLEELIQVIDSIMQLSVEEQEDLFPIKHDGKIQSYIEGEDIKIVAVQSMNTNIQALHIPSTCTNVNWRELARDGVVLSFDKDHAQFGTWTSKNGELIDTSTQTLKYVYPDVLTGDTYTTTPGVKSVDFSAFESYADQLKTINIAEGVIAVSGTLEALETTQPITINMPTTLKTINSEMLVYREDAKNNVTVFLKSLATYPTGSGIEAYRYARDDNMTPTYVVSDELYAQLITELPEFRDSIYANQLISYSVYVSR